MAVHGKHAYDSSQVKVGKHGVVVRSQHSAWRGVAAILMVIVLGAVPVSVAWNNADLDSRAFADSTRTAFVGVDDMTSRASEGGWPTKPANYTARIGAKMQNSLMTGGCEIVALGVVLESMGIDADLDTIVEDCLNIDGHFATGYSGNPYSEGAGFPPGIAAAANGYLEGIGADVRAHDLTGLSFDEVKSLVNLGYPVLVWSTMCFEDPQFTGMFDGDTEWYNNEHCVVLYEFFDGKALVSDPLEGLVTRDGERFADIYAQCGSRAVAIF